MPDLKKIPPWAWVVGAVGIGAALYLYKKHKEQTELTSETGSESSTEIVPEAEPYPYAVGEGAGGSGGGGSGAIGNAGEQPFTELFGSLLQGQREMSQEQAEQQRSFLQTILETQRSAVEAQQSGTTISSGSSGGPPASGTGVVAPPKSVPASKCPGAFPHLNGSVAGPHTCYKDVSRGMTGPKGAKATCTCHSYQDGHNECQHVVGGKCSW